MLHSKEIKGIQSAIGKASIGDTVIVSPKVYREKLIINKSIDLIGEKAVIESFNYNTIYNAYDRCNNQGNGNIGNYWDDYKGKDENKDGIEDTPYYIKGGNNKDKYPLMSFQWAEGKNNLYPNENDNNKKTQRDLNYC